MITVEDLVIKLAQSHHISIQIYDYRIVSSFTNQIYSGNGFTEKQAALALKIIKKYHKMLTADTGVDILKFIENPIYKNSFRKQNTAKKITVSEYKTDNIVGKIIKVEFPFNEALIQRIRENRSTLGIGFWNKEQKAWFFSLCEQNLIFLSELADHEKFETDEEFRGYINQIKDIIKEVDQYVPMLVCKNNVLGYKNVLKFVPPLEAKEILPAIFEARKRGIMVWDDTIENYLKNYENSMIHDFLLQETGEPFYIDCTKTEISCLKEIVHYLRPLIFVIPGGSELEKTTQAYNFLKTCGIADENISVLFRLPSDTGKNFNDFVKYNNLNNPISEKTEIAFISGKIPKPLIKARIKFNSIINMGFENPHLFSRYFVESHQNLIYYSEKPIQRQFLWQSLEL